MRIRKIGTGDYKLVARQVPGFTPEETFVRVGFETMPDAIDRGIRLASEDFDVFRISDGTRVFASHARGTLCPSCGHVNGGHATDCVVA